MCCILSQPMTSPENYRQLAAEEVALAEAAVTNESRAHHYAMAAYYLRLAEAKEKLARTNDVLSGDTDGDSGLGGGRTWGSLDDATTAASDGGLHSRPRSFLVGWPSND